MSLLDEDRWDWLESPEAPECTQWVKEEVSSTINYLDSLPQTELFKEKLKRLIGTNSPPPEYFFAGQLFRWRRDASHKRGILESCHDTSQLNWKKVFDLDELSKMEERAWEITTPAVMFPALVIGSNPSRILLLLSDGGSDQCELREFDIDKGIMVADGFRAGASRLSVAWLDIDHVLIGHTLNEGPLSAAGWPLNAYIWTRGTELKDAQLVHSGLPNDTIMICTSVGARETRRGLIMRCPDYSTCLYYVVSHDGTVKQAELPHKTLLSHDILTTSNHIVVSVTDPVTVYGEEVPTGAVLAWDTTGADNGTTIVYVPNDDEVNANAILGGLSASSSRVHMILSKRGQERRVVIDYQDGVWSIIKSVEVLPGTSTSVHAVNRSNNDIILRASGLLTPSRTWFEASDGNETALDSQPPAFNSENYTVEIRTAQSKDSTPIDYYFLSPKSSSPNFPILMTGYGAFSLSFPIEYLNDFIGGLSLVPWLESGGGLAIALIRGGGERGEPWHKAALREKRQNSYDDFAAVAEQLIKEGHAKPERIGVFGTSNGGLLAAVMGTQRPDLFGAILSDVPLTDMLRYPLLAMGAIGLNEYGDPKDPELAKVLRSYSPFHNVKPGVKYPPFLLTSSTMDDRVGAGHARKLVARLKEVNSPKVFLYEEGEGGHKVSDSLTSTVLMARRIAFLVENLQ